MIDEILLFLAKKVGHAGGGEHIYIYIHIYNTHFLSLLEVHANASRSPICHMSISAWRRPPQRDQKIEPPLGHVGNWLRRPTVETVAKSISRTTK